MPGMDGTGPLGYGPGTGGGFGHCGNGRRLNRRHGYATGYASAQYGPRRSSAYVHEDDPVDVHDEVLDDKLHAEMAEIKEHSAALETKLAELTKLVQDLSKSEPKKATKADKPH